MASAGALAAYGGVLDNYFYEIDDPGHLIGRRYPFGHFRPVHRGYIQLLFQLFGAAPAGYYLTGLALHVTSAVAAGLLALRLSTRPAAPGAAMASWAALLATGTFAVFFAPHEAVLWISASCSLLVVAFLLLFALAWDRYLVSGRAGPFWLAMLAALLALGAKDEGVLLLPLALGLDLFRCGRPRWRPFLRRYALLAVLGGVYLVIAVRSSLLTARGYRPSAALVPKLVENYAGLFWLEPLDQWNVPGWSLAAGALLLVALAYLGWRERRRVPAIGLGLLVSLTGLLPALPLPVEGYATQRHSYPSAIGVALLVAGLFEAGARAAGSWRRAPRLALGACAGLVGLAWLGAQVLAIRSVEQRRFEGICARFRNAIESTRELAWEAQAASAPAGGASGRLRAVVIAPPANPLHYARGLHVLAGIPIECLDVRYLRVEQVLAGLEAGRWPAAVGERLFTGARDGRITRVDPADVPRAAWEDLARLRARLGQGETVPVVEIREPGGTLEQEERQDGGAGVAG